VGGVPTTKVIVRACVVVLALAGFAMASAGAQACTKTWNSTDGSWASSASWTPTGMPGPDDDVCITGAGTYTVTVPVLNGGAQIRSLTVGGTAGGTQTLAIVGQSAPVGGATLSGSTVNATAGGTIAATGRIVLDATDQGTPAASNVQTGGPVTLSGGAFTNNGSLVAQSESNQPFRDYLRVPFTNAAGGTVQVTTGFLDYTGGLTFENDGTLTAADSGTFLLESDLPLSGPRTHLINAGGVTIGASTEVDNAIWTQAGGSVTGRALRMLNSALDYQSGSGSFTFASGYGTSDSSLSGTIPPGQTVTAQGGSFGDPTDSHTYTLQLTGDQVVNRGTLFLAGVSGATALAGSAAVQGAPLINYGTILATSTPDGSGSAATYPDYLRTDLTNKAGGEIDVQGVLTQDAGTVTLNEGTVALSGGGAYSVSRNSTAVRASTFTNSPDGTISTRLDPTSVPVFSISSGATFNGAGSLLPILVQPLVPRQGREFRLLVMSGGGTVVGRFDHIAGGFSADYAHAGYVGAIFGLKVGNIVGGRGSFAVALTCPSGSRACVPASVRASALERLRVTIGTGTHRRTRVRTRRVGVAMRAAPITAGHMRTFLVQLNRAGLRLLAQSTGTLAVQVTVSAHGRTLATRRVRVQRL
jgi:hypothetical protein